MKKLLIFISIAALLSSCASNDASRKNDISIRMKNGTQSNYKLLAVRYFSLVVFPTDEKYEERTSISHAKVFDYDSIASISNSSVFPIVIGGGIGALCGFAAAEVIPHTSRVEGDIAEIAPPFMWYFIPIGAFIGAAIAYIASDSDNNFDLLDAKSFHRLRSISLYPNGEPEMLKLVH